MKPRFLGGNFGELVVVPGDERLRHLAAFLGRVNRPRRIAHQILLEVAEKLRDHIDLLPRLRLVGLRIRFRVIDC